MSNPITVIDAPSPTLSYSPAFVAIMKDKISDFESGLTLLRENPQNLNVAIESLLIALFNKRQTKMLEKLIAKFPEVYSYKNNKKQNIAHLLAKENWITAGDIVRNFPEHLMKEKDSNTLTPFYYACSKATGDLWNAYLEHPFVDVKIIDSNLFNFSPVYLASFSRNPEKVKSLLAKGADGNFAEKAGFKAIDLAIKNKDWDIVTQLIHGVELIQPKMVLEVVKDLPRSLKILEGFIENEEVCKKLFPLPVENRETVWSFIFYYAPWTLLEKNMPFIKQYFLEDLKQEPNLNSIFYSIMSGKRDSLKKVNWFLNQKEWISLNSNTLNSVATFNKDIPNSYALHFSKLSNEEWQEAVNHKPSWLKSLSFADKNVFNIISLTKGTGLIYPNILEERWDKDEGKKFNKSRFSESCAGEYLKNLVKSIPASVAHDNFSYLSGLSQLNFLSVTNNDIYMPFAEKALASDNVLDYFNSLQHLNVGKPTKIFIENHFASAFMEKLVKATYKTQPNLDDVFNQVKEHYLFRVAYQNVLENEIRSPGNIKMGNFNASMNLDFDDYLVSSVISLVSKKSHQYSKERLNLMNLIKKEIFTDFKINTDFFKSIKFKNPGINVPFVEKVLEIDNEDLKYSLLSIAYMQGEQFITQAASEKLLNVLTNMPDRLFEPILTQLAKTEHHKNSNVIDLLKIAMDKGFKLSQFWEEVDSKDNKSDFYIDVCSGVNDFSSFFHFFVVEDAVDCFELHIKRKDENFVNYLKGQAVEDLKKNCKDFKYSTSMFMMLHIFSFDNRVLEIDDLNCLKMMINKSFPISMNDITGEPVTKALNMIEQETLNKVLNVFESDVFPSDLKLDLIDHTNLNFIKLEKLEKIRAVCLSDVLNNEFINVKDDSSNSDLDSQTFKL